jgi:hypothetical protein
MGASQRSSVDVSPSARERVLRPLGVRLGARVRVSPGFGWPSEPTGVVRSIFSGMHGVLVEFDEPQRDADDDGPYVRARIPEHGLRRL